MQLHLVIVADGNGHLHSLRAEKQRIVGQRKDIGRSTFDWEAHLRIAPERISLLVLGTCNSTWSVREARSTAPAVRVTVASNSWFGMS